MMPYHRILKDTNKGRQSADPGAGKSQKSLKSLKLSTAELALNGNSKKMKGGFAERRLRGIHMDQKQANVSVNFNAIPPIEINKGGILLKLPLRIRVSA